MNRPNFDSTINFEVLLGVVSIVISLGFGFGWDRFLTWILILGGVCIFVLLGRKFGWRLIAAIVIPAAIGFTMFQWGKAVGSKTPSAPVVESLGSSASTTPTIRFESTMTATPSPTPTSTPALWPITVGLDYSQESSSHPSITRTIVKVEIYEDKTIWFVEYFNDSPYDRYLGFNWDVYLLDFNGDLFSLATARPDSVRIVTGRRLEYRFEFDSPAIAPGEYTLRINGERGGSAASSVHFDDAHVEIFYSLHVD